MKHAWSYTALTAFETCPRKFYLERVSKQVKEPQSDALIWGNTVHSHLEQYAASGTPLPDHLQSVAPIVDRMKNAGGELWVEKQIALDENFNKTSWFSKTTWCRSVIDLGLVKKNSAILLDWKTGKYKPDNDQLELFAGVGFAAEPEVDTVKTMFVWLKGDGPPTVKEYTREDNAKIWQGFLERTARLDYAYDNNKWEPRPNGLCKRYCSVGKKLCDYCGS